MTVIAVANQKGGCAKTTTVVNLACALAEHGLRTLVLDLDPQANATQWVGIKADAKGTFEFLVDDEPFESLICTTRMPGVDVMAGSKRLSQIEKSLSGQIAVESLLKRRLSKVDLGGWDIILIDTPPTLGLLTLNALAAADELLVPVTTHVMSLIGVSQLVNTLNEVREVLNTSIDILGYLPSRVDLRTRHAKDVIELLKQSFGDKVLSSIVRENVSLAEAPSFNQGIMTYKPSSSAAEDYRALTIELLKKLKLDSK
ncbi:ParA family protein [Polynucleobacter necessarius]|uniref:ParA family protein n=1 Tax=Polynucleobacter necessarius TaxID=576610 RepID=UPI0013B0528D|nr:ParA family protein [Polynucleobacter necessarius]